MELLLKNWYSNLFNELKNTKDLRIISPFVKEQIVRKIGDQFNLRNLELITRYNLGDFASNVSSIQGLRYCVEEGATIYGIKDLHSKVYLFDRSKAIITSANMTIGGLQNNYECGVLLDNKAIIEKLHDYFDELVAMNEQKLTLDDCDNWLSELDKVNKPNSDIPALPDFGASTKNISKDKNYFIKFFGASDSRVPWDYPVRTEVDRALCHYACGFSEKKRPRQIMDGDVVYMARLIENPNNYAIFGRAEAIKHVEIRDEATEEEKKERPWKRTWFNYLRVTNSVFIDGAMSDCIFLYDLIEKLDYESFPSTKSRYEKGERNIEPIKSLSQKAYIQLTQKAVEWLEPRFQETLNRVGRVDDEFIRNLPQASIDYSKIIKHK